MAALHSACSKFVVGLLAGMLGAGIVVSELVIWRKGTPLPSGRHVVVVSLHDLCYRKFDGHHVLVVVMVSVDGHVVCAEGGHVGSVSDV